MEAFVVSAKLLVPEAKFIPVTKIETSVFGALGFPCNLNEGIKITPEDASIQTINWSIISFLPAGSADIPANWQNAPSSAASDAAALATYKTNVAAFDTEVVTQQLIPEKSFMDYSYLPPVKVVLSPATISDPVTRNKDGVVIGKALGKLKVRATIVEGGANEANYTQDLIVPIMGFSPAASTVVQLSGKAASATVSGTTVTVKHRFAFGTDYAYIDGDTTKVIYREPTISSGPNAAKSNLFFYLDSGTLATTPVFKDLNGNTLDSDPTEYTSGTPANGYGLDAAKTRAFGANNWGGDVSGGSIWACLKVTLPGATLLQQYGGIVFTVKGLTGDVNWKDPMKIKLYTDSTLPTSGTWMNNDDNNIATIALGGSVDATGGTFMVRPSGATSTTNEIYLVFFYNVPGWNGSKVTSSYSIGDLKFVNKPE